MRLYRESRLEGAVFIGDIPIPDDPEGTAYDFCF